MVFSSDERDLELVKKAIALGQSTRGCCEWEDRASRRIRRSPPLEGFTPEGIRELLINHLQNHPDQVIQVREKRAEYPDRLFYYKVIFPVSEFVRGLFVELILVDQDPDYPSVLIVNAHEQRS